MNVPRTAHLRVKLGELLSAAKWNGLLDLVDEAIATRPGPGVRRRSLPNGTILIADGRSKGGTASMGDYPSKVTMTQGVADTQLKATFNRVLISGVEPTIQDRKVSLIDPATNDLPFYQFNIADAIDTESGRGMLYWKITFNTDYSVSRIEPLALKAVPALIDYTYWKLVGFLQREPADPQAQVEFKPMLFNNLNHTASQRHGGRAVHRFWAT